MEEKKITPYQFFSMLLLIHTITALTCSPKLSYSEGLWDFILSAILSFLMSFVLMAPSYMLYKKYPTSNMFLGKLGVVYIIIYAIYFIWLTCYIVSILKIFIINVMPSEIPVVLLSLFIIIGGIYAAYKGMHAIARTAVIIMFLIGISMIVIVFSLFQKIEPENTLPFMRSGIDETIKGTIYIVSRNFALPIIAVLLPELEGNKAKTIVTWNFFTHILSLVVVSMTVEILGKYQETQPFPVYTATRMAELGVFKRLDAVYVGIFVTAGFILVSMFFYVFSLVCLNLKKRSLKEIAILLGIIMVFVICIFIPQSKEFYYFIFNGYILLIYTITTASILPLIFFVKNLITEIRSKKDEKSISYN